VKLLGKQRHQAEETCRLMDFVVQVDFDNGLLLLHNSQFYVMLANY